jgi:RNA polymerase sigma factor (sigma-70 family)
MADDAARLGELYSRIGPPVAALVAARLRIGGDAAFDAVHDVFVTILGNADLRRTVLGLDARAAFRYLFVACVRRYLHERRKRIGMQFDSLEEILARDERSEETQSLAEMEEVVAREIAGMEQPYRDVLHKLLIEEKAAVDIGRELGRPVNTIYQQVHRGLQRLRERLLPALRRQPYTDK